MQMRCPWENEMALGANYRSGIPRNHSVSQCEEGVIRMSRTGCMDFMASRGDGRRKNGGIGSCPFRISSAFSNPVYLLRWLLRGLHDSIRGFDCVRSSVLFRNMIDEGGLKVDVAAGFNATYDRGVEESQYAGYRFQPISTGILVNRHRVCTVEISGNVEEPLEDYYGWLVLGLKSGLLDSVSLFAELRDEYDNMPDAVGSKRNDLLFNLGLMYDF